MQHLQSALSSSTFTMAAGGGSPKSQASQRAPEIVPADNYRSSSVEGTITAPHSTRASSQQKMPPTTPPHGTDQEHEAGEGGGGGMRRRANTMFFMNQFQALQASLAEVAAAAAGAQQQAQQQQQQAQQAQDQQGGRGRVATPRASVAHVQGPLQHYLNSVRFLSVHGSIVMMLTTPHKFLLAKQFGVIALSDH